MGSKCLEVLEQKTCTLSKLGQQVAEHMGESLSVKHGQENEATSSDEDTDHDGEGHAYGPDHVYDLKELQAMQKWPVDLYLRDGEVC